MRYGILGDVHGNLEALEVALEALASERVDRYLQMGDIVGYGADPNECIQILKDLDAVVVAGNHDEAVLGRLDAECFNEAAHAAVEWTRSNLRPSGRRFLESLPLVAIVDDEVTMVHSSPDEPDLFDYVLCHHDAARALECFDTRVCFIGHSHVPAAFILNSGVEAVDAEELTLEEDQSALINVGAVGQPRDENPACAFAVYDSETTSYQLFRRPYDIDAAANKILDAGLPRLLAERLYLGL